MKSPTPRLFWQTFLAISAILSILAFYQTYIALNALEANLLKSRFSILFVIYILNFILGIWLLWDISKGRRGTWVNRMESVREDTGSKLIAVCLIVIGLSAVWVIRWTLFKKVIPEVYPSLWLLWWGTFIAALGLRWWTRASWYSLFALILVIQGACFVAYGYLQPVTDYPFSLGYSEGSRFYYGSLLFSKSLYKMQLPLSFLHPTRYFLMAIPFLIQGLPLWADRLWQSLLWIGLTACSSCALAKRLRLNNAAMFGFIVAWFFIYCFQGPIYYHLQVMVIIVLFGVQPQKFWRSLIAVLIASFWAGMSRVNWFPVPAMLAMTLYFLEEPVSVYRNFIRYLIAPVMWGILGTVTALFSQAWYIIWSGNSQTPEVFASSFKSPLLWYRLLPNATYPLGVVIGIVLVSLPLWIAIFVAVRGKFRLIHWVRWLGLVGITLTLLIGGAIVSTKIGGGADLHNTDAYLITLASIALYFFANRTIPESGSALWGRIHWPIVAACLIIPLSFEISAISPYFTYNRTVVKQDLQTLQQTVAQAENNHGSVLFISERQLITFNMIHGVPLVPQYELVTLMEMAMSSNTAYLNQFYADLRNHRFALIIASKQSIGIHKVDQSFAAENNAWNTLIARPLLCEYEPSVVLDYESVAIYAPRPGNPKCP
jgi:hypothetical protein